MTSQLIQGGFFALLGVFMMFRGYIPGIYSSLKARFTASQKTSPTTPSAEEAVEAVFTLSRYLATEKEAPEYKQVVAMLKTLEPLT